MATRDNQYIEALFNKIDQLPVATSMDVARVLPLYIKASNDRGVVKNMSLAYIDNYDGKAFHKRFKRHLEQICAVFTRKGLLERDVRAVFKRVAFREPRIPTSIREMESLKGIVFEEVQAYLRGKRLVEKRMELVSRFKTAVKHYMNMTYELGFNEPSACAKFLAESHKIDKYILAGDFAVLLLPFLPELEDTIRKCYEHYEMKDAWEILKGRYFNHKAEYANLATEIKSTFKRAIPNFSLYFDDLYTNTYYKTMLSRGRNING